MEVLFLHHPFLQSTVAAMPIREPDLRPGKFGGIEAKLPFASITRFVYLMGIGPAAGDRRSHCMTAVGLSFEPDTLLRH